MLILFYQKIRRSRFSFYDQLKIDSLSQILPENIEITYNRDLLAIADVVVFNVPFLYRDLEDDLEKVEGQIWIGWSYESEVNYPWMLSEEIKELFDLWMTYHNDADIVLPYYDYTYKEKLLNPTSEKTKDVCMFISSSMNKSSRIEYLTELMKYLDIDSYGNWQRNKFISHDEGYTTKLNIIKDYKFTIAFENAIGKDYVTEKFFDPLIMGSVPIYLGAPNINEFLPGKNSFIDVRNYPSAQSLALDIKKYCEDSILYSSLLEWKHYPLNKTLMNLIDDQKKHPFIRLANAVNLISRRI